MLTGVLASRRVRLFKTPTDGCPTDDLVAEIGDTERTLALQAGSVLP